LLAWWHTPNSTRRQQRSALDSSLDTRFTGWNFTAIAGDSVGPKARSGLFTLVIVARKNARETHAHNEVNPQADYLGLHVPTDLR
jgi:hypothetical protein